MNISLPMRAITAALRVLLLANMLLATLPAQVRTGIDVLAATECAPLHGRKLGLITNHTGRTADGRRSIDVLASAPGVQLLALFSPEHGPAGTLDAAVPDARDATTGLPIHSLYGEHRRPTAAMLQGLDTLVFDIQDVGCRFYTYGATLRHCLEAAAEHGLRLVVLDRPNPLGGKLTEGPVLAEARRDFVGAYRVPLRHGLTLGELARLCQGEEGLQVDLQVVRCEGWQRADLWDRTGLPWIDPSPNLRSPLQALLYPGIGLLEGTNLSVGRGTDTPFERIGAPWLDGRALQRAIHELALPGLRCVPIEFTPQSSVHAGQRCGGVQFLVTDWQRFEPVRSGLGVALALRAVAPKDWDTRRLDWLLKDAAIADGVRAGAKLDELVASWQADLRLFRMRSKPFLLYE